MRSVRSYSPSKVQISGVGSNLNSITLRYVTFLVVHGFPAQTLIQAIAWGGLPHELFAAGKIYSWVPYAYIIGFIVPVPFWLVHRRYPGLHLDYLYTPVICYFIGWLCVGINSSILSYFTIAFISQYYLRPHYPRWFAKYNYILGAGESCHILVRGQVLISAIQLWTVVLRLWSSSFPSPSLARRETATCSRSGGVRTRTEITIGVSSSRISARL